MVRTPVENKNKKCFLVYSLYFVETLSSKCLAYINLRENIIENNECGRKYSDIL